jgi:cobalt-zinc-cadmium efflux system outer membrane protein
MFRFAALALLMAGCAATRSPLPDRAQIRETLSVPVVPAAPAPDRLPDAPPILTDASRPLSLDDVINQLSASFPLILAIEQERGIAAGQKLTAEGSFDTILRARAVDQSGTFSNGRVDLLAEQPILGNGGSVFAGWRVGDGNFPIYYGDRKTADGGEFRTGVVLPLARDRTIDRRRVALRQAQIQEQLADPTIRRARLDYARAAALAYWSWVAAGEQYRIARELLALARDRQGFVDERFKLGADPETLPVLNKRLTASREESLLSAERGLQSAAFRLSLFLRDPAGNPTVPAATQLPAGILDKMPAEPRRNQLADDVVVALRNRPEIERFQLLKERAATDLALARNRTRPGVNAFAAAAQDVGFSKKTAGGSGPFATDRTTAEFGVTFELEAQRRDALGRLRAAEALLAQLAAQERFARDEIAVQIQDATSEIVLTYKRLERAREEYRQAARVRELETESFRLGRTSLVDLNLQEIATAEAQLKIAVTAGAYYRAIAEYLAALGIEPGQSQPEIRK